MPATTMELEGKRYVVMPQDEYEHLVRLAEHDALPDLPPPDERGRRPAADTGRLIIARTVKRRRLAAGLEQKELARLARVRAETVSRIESGKYRPRRQTLSKLNDALDEMEKNH